VLWYEYQETREKKHITELLSGFSGYLQSDGYGCYESAAEQDLTGVVHVGCFAHVRRHFFEAKQITTQPGLADQALEQIQGLYKVERELREKLRNEEIDRERFVAERRETCEPKLTALHGWLMANQAAVPPASKIGSAICYTLKIWPSLPRYLEDWQLTPDNNACERGIRPFVMGRKNRVMSGSPCGAKSSCELYTLIETAKANNWNPAKYLTRIFEKAAKMNTGDDWSRLLPGTSPNKFYRRTTGRLDFREWSKLTDTFNSCNALNIVLCPPEENMPAVTLGISAPDKMEPRKALSMNKSSLIRGPRSGALLSGLPRL
jgi:hypothetical protein